MAKSKAQTEKEEKEIENRRIIFESTYSRLTDQNKLVVYKTLAALAHIESTLLKIAFYSLIGDKCNILKIEKPYQLHNSLLSDKMSKEAFYTMLRRRQYPGQLASMTLEALGIDEAEVEVFAKELEYNYKNMYSHATIENIPFPIEFLYDNITDNERNALLVLISALHNNQIPSVDITDFESPDYYNCPPEINNNN